MEKLIDTYDIELAEPACRVGSSRMGALVTLPDDISAVFPYLNAVEEKARYDHANEVLILDEPGQLYAFRPREIRIAEVRGAEDARRMAGELADRLNRLWEERESITHDYTERKPPPVMAIYRLLPGTNCRLCGYPTCMAFAAGVSQGKARIEDCPPLEQPEFAGNLDRLRELVHST